MFKVITGTLQANHSTMQLTDETITNDSIFEVYADTENVIPTSVNVGSHTVTITFDSKPSNNVGIKVLINNIVGEFAPDTIDAENVTYTNYLVQTNNVKDTLDTVLYEFADLDAELHTDTVLGGVLYHATTGNEWKKLTGDNVNYDADTTINEKLDEVFQSVSNGKELLADAITDKGVETSADDTFETMANNILSISGGSDIDTSLNANWYTNLSDCVDNGFQKFRLSSETEHIVNYNSNTRELEILSNCIAMFSYENDHSSSNVAEMNIYINSVSADTFNIPINSYVFRIYNFSVGDRIKVHKASGGWSCIAACFIKKA